MVANQTKSVAEIWEDVGAARLLSFECRPNCQIAPSLRLSPLCTAHLRGRCVYSSFSLHSFRPVPRLRGSLCFLAPSATLLGVWLFAPSSLFSQSWRDFLEDLVRQLPLVVDQS